MPVCKRLAGCAFYQSSLIANTGIGEILKKKYCECNNISECARYMVLSQIGAEYLNNDLFPNMVTRAQALIDNVKGVADGNDQDFEEEDVDISFC